MGIQLLQPQELEVYYILPSLRRELARELKKLGKSQKAIAQLFGITEPAVSQYVHEKRGTDITLTPEMQAEVKMAAQRITDHITFIREIQQLLNKVWKQRFICTICHEQNKNAIPRDCVACFE